MERLTVLMFLVSALAPAAAQRPAETEGTLQLWRLDCGSLDVDLSEFSDTGLYRG